MNKAAFLLLFASSVLSAAQANQAPSSFVQGTKQDEAEIRAIVKDSAKSVANPHVAPDLDWENAFGIRYNDLKKRNKFYGDVVAPLQKDDTDSTLEVKVRFLAPNTAVADEYWHIVGQLDIETHKPGPDRWGRTTYIFTKQNGAWVEVLERVADLRFAYYKHYDELPAAASVPPEMLASYAGIYAFSDDQTQRTITAEGDHLTFSSPKGKKIAVPSSAADFLLFDPDDLSEYSRLHFEEDVHKKMTITVSDESGAPVATMIKVR